MYGWIVKNVLARSLDYSRGTKTMRCLDDLKKSQWWPQDKIIELQNERLRKLIEHAYSNVPYYRQIFNERGLKPADIECGADISKLPVLNKSIIKNNFELLKAQDLHSKNTIVSSTSGSTGEPLVFLTTEVDQHNWGYARAQRARSWSGYKMGDRIASFRPRIPNDTATKRMFKDTKRYLKRTLLFDPSNMSDSAMPSISKRLQAFRPKFLAGYASAIYLLACYAKTHRMPAVELEAIITAGDQLYDYQRELFSKVFHCETYSYYSSWEVHDIAGECSQHTGYHIAAENVILEIADESGNPVPAGVEGRILLTNLHNFAMPFIRYDIGDSGATSNQICPCGRVGLPLLVKLNGRADAVILTRSGKAIPGRALPQRFLGNLGVKQYQLVQESYDEVIVNLVLDKDYTSEYIDEVSKQIKGQYQPRLGNDVIINVKFVEQIAPSKSGKRDIIISKIAPKIAET